MGCACSQARAQTDEERKTLRIALALNLAMFVIGTTAGILAQSSGLLADALDMLADASAYAIGLLAVARPRFQAPLRTTERHPAALTRRRYPSRLGKAGTRWSRAGRYGHDGLRVAVAGSQRDCLANAFAISNRGGSSSCHVPFHSSRCRCQHRRLRVWRYRCNYRVSLG
jgi:hypothetical protein